MTLTIDAPTLAGRLGGAAGADPVLIDVRTSVEFEAGHIPGAVNVPLDDLRGAGDQLVTVFGGTSDLVLVCRSGQRARQAQQALQSVGVDATTVLAGGMVDWERTGGPMNRGRQAWELERQVRLAAGSLVLGGILASTVAPKAKWLAGFVGGGLVFAALSDTCAMGVALARMPWNRRGARRTGSALDQLTGNR